MVREKERCDCGRYVNMGDVITVNWICNVQDEDGGHKYFKTDRRDIKPTMCPFCGSKDIDCIESWKYELKLT